MKVIIVCFALLAAASASQVHHVPRNELGVGNAIDNLIRSALEYIRTWMKKNEPFSVPIVVPTQRITDDSHNLDLNTDLVDVKLSKCDTFQVGNLNTNLFKLWAKFDATIPVYEVDGTYHIRGTVNGNQVTADGSFRVVSKDIPAGGETQLEIVDHAMHMKDITLYYKMLNLEFKFTDGKYNIDGISQQDLEQILSVRLLDYFQKDADEFTGQIAKLVQDYSNSVMKGKTLQQLLDWLKQHLG